MTSKSNFRVTGRLPQADPTTDLLRVAFQKQDENSFLSAGEYAKQVSDPQGAAINPDTGPPPGVSGDERPGSWVKP